MSIMKKYIISTLIGASIAVGACAQELTNNVYRRSSLYQILINHQEQKFANDIREVFLDIPVSEHFNNHDLAVKVVDMDEKLKRAGSANENSTVTNFLERNKIASRLVAKWFDRDFYTGKCDMDLIRERGLYNASEIDKIAASHSVRGNALLEDAGEDLIGNTFVIVNDIRYIDKENRGKAISAGLGILGGVLGAMYNVDLSDLTQNLQDMAETLKGFKVNVNTFLYQLVWNDDIAAEFYQNQYGMTDNSAAKTNFENARDNYKLRYIGKQENSGSNTSFLGVNLDTPTAMVRKACQRAIDENVAELQHSYEAFRTKTPLISVEPLTAYVGLKEGVSEHTRFEVLETVQKENGKVEYKRVGIIQPIKNLIWDNRYMAVEENATNATLGYTTFKKVSGGDFYQGMLIREMNK
jgi:hypothetical protein